MVTYINGLLEDSLRLEIQDLLNEFKDYFVWDYKDMLGLNRGLVNHRLPIKAEFKPFQ